MRVLIGQSSNCPMMHYLPHSLCSHFKLEIKETNRMKILLLIYFSLFNSKFPLFPLIFGVSTIKYMIVLGNFPASEK